MRIRRRDYINIVIIVLLIMSSIGGVAAYKVHRDTLEATSRTYAENEIPIDENTLIILFTHAGDDENGNPVENQIFIQEVIKEGDIPSYSDKDQAVIISCENGVLYSNAVTALQSMGYNNIVRLED